MLDPVAFPQIGTANFVTGVLLLALLAGLLTRWVAVVCCLAAIAKLFFIEFGMAMLPHLMFAFCSAALMLLGAGAYSLDAMLFGRRVVKIPD